MSTETETATASASSSAPSGHAALVWSGTAGAATLSGMAGGAYSPYCLLTGFGFSVPVGAAISDVSASINRSWSVAGGSPTAATDESVQMIVGGALNGTELSSGAFWSGANTYDAGTVGGASVSQFNDSPNFGVAISGKANGPGSTNLAVNSASITITYSTSGEENLIQSRTVLAPPPLASRRAESAAYQGVDYPATLRPNGIQEGADEIARRMEIWNEDMLETRDLVECF